MLTDETMVAWARESVCAYGLLPYVAPEPLTLRDVDLAKDVAWLMPMLYATARFMVRLDDPVGAAPVRTFLEIGTADGSTAIPLAKAAAELGGRLHSVDPSDCPDAHRLIATFGYGEHWTHHQMASDHFFAGPGATLDLDFAFVDGDHRWPVVERDIRNCYARLRPGGILWLSDYEFVRKGTPDFDHEWDGGDYQPHVGGDPVGEAQMANGVGKAALRALPKLLWAQSMVLPIYPNPSILIRKLATGERDLQRG